MRRKEKMKVSRPTGLTFFKTNFSRIQLMCSLACMMMSNMFVSLCITANPLTKSASSPSGGREVGKGGRKGEGQHVPVYMLVRSNARDGRDFPCSALLNTVVAVAHTTDLSAARMEKLRSRCSSPRMTHW